MVSVNAPLGASVESPYGEWSQQVGLGEDWTGWDLVKFGRPWDTPLLCVSQGTTHLLRAPLKWQEAQERSVLASLCS